MTRKLKILIVDDEKNICWSLAEFLSFHGYEVDHALSGIDGLKKLAKQDFDVVISDQKMPVMDGYTFAKEVQAKYPSTTIIIMTAHGNIQDAVEVIKHGIYDYLVKPINTDELLKKLAEVKPLGAGQASPTLGDHPLFRMDSQEASRIKDFVKRAAESEHNVLLTGETGTGKTELGHLIHQSGPRKDMAFIYLNCAAVSPGLIESELFGHVRGAFTGADQSRSGKLLMADKGTLFLDEIGSTTVQFQSKLLNVLQTKNFEQVGSDKPLKTDARFIAATNLNLDHAIQKNEFRSDLYYRLKILFLELPPLRHRKSDLPFLIDHFVQKYRSTPSTAIHPSAYKKLLDYSWPGNIRELENVLAAALDMGSGDQIVEADLLFDTPSLPQVAGDQLDKLVAQTEKEAICASLIKHGGNIASAALELSIHERSLRRKMKLYGLSRKDFVRPST